MIRKYNGGGCGCGGTPMLPQNGGDNNNNNNNGNGNSAGLMGMMKGFFGGQNTPNGSSSGPSNGNGMQMQKASMPARRKGMKSNSGMPSDGNGMQMEQASMPVNAMTPNGSSNGMPMKRASRGKRSRGMKSNSGMPSDNNGMQMQKASMPVNAMTPNGSSNGMPMKRASRGKRSRGMPMKKSSLSARNIKFNNGSSLQGQVANMQQNLNSITGKKKMRNSSEISQQFGGQNNLASLHNKIDEISHTVENIKESNGSINGTNVGLFGGEYPIANVFLQKEMKNGGGIIENVGSLFGVSNQTNTAMQPMPIDPINTSVEEPQIATNSSLPDPTSVVNKPTLNSRNMQSTNAQLTNAQLSNVQTTNVQATGGNESKSIVNSLFGGYRATKRNRKYLKRHKRGKSIGFTMRSSLKAKGLLRRANGTRRVSKKYRG